MNTYEMTYIVRPDRDEDGTRAVVDGVAARLASNGGEVLATVPWNPPRRRMAYPIKDFGDGFYVTTVFRFDPQTLVPFENWLKLNDNVLRYLIVTATENNVQQAQQRMQQANRPQPAPESAPAQPQAEAPAETQEAAQEAPQAPEPQPVGTAAGSEENPAGGQ